MEKKKRQLHEIWKEKYGSKNVWYVQAPKGRLCFKTYRDAFAWVASFELDKKGEK